MSPVFKPNADLSDCDLSGMNLANKNLKGANLKGANLTNANLSGANLSGAILTNTNLTSTRFAAANPTFPGRISSNPANLYGVKSGGITGTPLNLPVGSLAKISTAFSTCYWYGCTYELSPSTGAGTNSCGYDDCEPKSAWKVTWSLVKGYLIGPGANLASAKLSGTDLRSVDLAHKTNLKGAYLTGANLSGNDLRYSDFTSAHMSGANLSGTWLQGAIFASATMTSANLTGVSGCQVSWGRQSSDGSHLWTRSYTVKGDGSDFGILANNVDGTFHPDTGATAPRRDCLSGVKTTCGWASGTYHSPPWSAVISCGVSFAKANLTGAKITGMLPSANFTGANLTNALVGTTSWASINGAKFTSAKLAGAKIEGGNKYYATFKGASTSSKTSFGNTYCTTLPNGKFAYTNGYWNSAGTFVSSPNITQPDYCPYPNG
jgi:uncharacterized protein YjbI with pentapeptide repeats